MGAHNASDVTEGAVQALCLVDAVQELLASGERKPEVTAQLYESGPQGRLEIARELGMLLCADSYVPRRAAIGYLQERLRAVHGITGYNLHELQVAFTSQQQM